METAGRKSDDEDPERRKTSDPKKKQLWRFTMGSGGWGFLFPQVQWSDPKGAHARRLAYDCK
jgi:hypothetical protein